MNYLKLTRLQLFHLVWAEPFTLIAKKYQISDQGLRKMCKRLEIPYPKTGHWQRVRAGRKITLPKFRANPDLGQTITLQLREPEVADPNEPELLRLQKEIEEDPRVSLLVPETLSTRNPHIILAKRSLTDSAQYRFVPDVIRTTNFNELTISVSRLSLGRALPFMDTLIKALMARGHELEVTHETAVIVYNHRVKLSLRETTKRVLAHDSVNKYEYVPTGNLAFQVHGYDKHSWKDGKETLEVQLSQILATIEIEGKVMRKKAFENAIREAERQEVARVKELFDKAQRKELKAFRELLENAKRWENAKTLRNFISALQEIPNLAPEDWLNWAKRKAEWYDPTVNGNDPYLIGVDQSVLEPTSLSPWEKDNWMRFA
jgi:hypothetical protein